MNLKNFKGWKCHETGLIELWKWNFWNIFFQKSANWFPAIFDVPNEELIFWYSRLNIIFIIIFTKIQIWKIVLTWTYKLCIRYFRLSIFLLFFQISTAEWLSHQLNVSTPNIPLYHRCTTHNYLHIQLIGPTIPMYRGSRFRLLTQKQAPFIFFTRKSKTTECLAIRREKSTMWSIDIIVHFFLKLSIEIYTSAATLSSSSSLRLN